MINDTLKNLGLGEKEISVYLAILQQGKITPAALSAMVGINRTTVYSVAKELSKKGLITEDLAGPGRYLIARPPSDLASLITQEERLLEGKRNLVNQAIGELADIAKQTNYALPKIIFVGEDELESHLYKQTPVWNESIMKRDGIWWGFQDQTFVEYYEKWIDWYWEKGSPANMNLRLLSNEVAEKIKKKKFERRKIRFWDQSKNFTATTWVNGDYVAMIVTSQRPHYMMEIHDAVLAHNLREVFKGIWNKTTQK
ncbi:MAG: helix-turn-helix domain-containing protein [bacterium]|nr:helix-turn-helix domain-containing protein [bacterium]